MKRILILLALSSTGYAGGDQPIPPPLPPMAPATTEAPKVTKEEKAPVKVDDSVQCTGAKIVCECNNAKPQVKTVTRTITKTVDKPVYKTIEKPVYRTITKVRLVEVPKEVIKEVPVEKIVYKDNPNCAGDCDDYTRHEFSLLLGTGPNGVKTELYGGEYQFQKDQGVTAGAMYQYSLSKNFGIGAAAFLNESYFGVLTFKK